MLIAKVKVTLKDGILDPQGKTIQNALPGLGIDSVDGVETGKYIELHFGDVDESKARKITEEACERLLSNPVIEQFSYELVEE